MSRKGWKFRAEYLAAAVWLVRHRKGSWAGRRLAAAGRQAEPAERMPGDRSVRPGGGVGPPGKEGQVRAGAAPRLGSQAGGGEAQSQPKGNLEGLQKV